MVDGLGRPPDVDVSAGADADPAAPEFVPAADGSDPTPLGAEASDASDAAGGAPVLRSVRAVTSDEGTGAAGDAGDAVVDEDDAPAAPAAAVEGSGRRARPPRTARPVAGF